jgi:hypothetical protein
MTAAKWAYGSAAIAANGSALKSWQRQKTSGTSVHSAGAGRGISFGFGTAKPAGKLSLFKSMIG